MLTVYNCIVNQHDFRLVGLAAAICALASFTAITLLQHVRKSTGYMHYVWLAVAAIATGFGIWATHFVAMLAFSPALPVGYDFSLTCWSLVAAVVITGVGLAITASPRTLPGSAWVGGAIVGGGIATMHYTGMAAFETEGRIIWDPVLVTASIVIGGLLGAAALQLGLRAGTRVYGAFLLTAAIVGHHFTAMGAVSIVPDLVIRVSPSAISSNLLAVAVALASFTIIILALAGLALDIRDQRRSKLEADSMRGLANAAVEGLIVCDDDVIVTVNNSFATLADCAVGDVIGAKLDEYIPDAMARLKLVGQASQTIEAGLRHSNGLLIPVELLLRPLIYVGKPHHAIAVRDLRARNQAEQHIRFLAHHDALTGLPNRASFSRTLDREIEEALSSGRQLAVICLDLDRFKEVNDLFGHAAGDQLLQTVARCVTGILDQNQLMARLGGDEFAIILPAISSPSVASRVAENILEVLRVENDRSASAALVSTSIGIAILPSDATDRQGLLSHADTALYRAKTEGRGTYRFFEASMGAEMHDRRLLEHDLRHAIPRREFRLVYQPQKDLKTDGVIGFEALLRWNHPTRGDISPGVFIPIAEESGTIIQIGEWVLRTACQEAAGWGRGLTVAVNVSAVQLHAHNFAHQLHEILLQTGMSAQRLEIEITETALIRDLNRALSVLRQVKMLGVRIVMDDFGTGYSSLSNLRAFPFDKIKIDRSFIKSVDVNEQTAAIVRAVLGLGRGLGLPVLAEGVESASELNFLSKELCDEFQGYYLGKPAGIEDFEHLTHETPGESKPPVSIIPEPEKRLRVVRE